jgi:transposase
MASIVGKRISGQTYYYLREVARIDGRPRIVSQRYLGKADAIAAAMAGASVLPERTRHLAFGALAATWSMLERLDLVGIVDRVVGARRQDAAASVGTYLALACANRVVAPCSKLSFADWWATTAADRWVKVPRPALDHRRFWEAMDALSPTKLARIERAVATRMVQEFGLDLGGLVLDMTNFATFIDTGNPHAPIAQRGHAKQKRTDLRLVGLALVVTRDGQVPICARAYPGNRPDVTQFTAVVDELLTRFTRLGADPDQLTLVYDAGNDSAANQTHLEQAGLHFVGSLVPSDHPDLLAISTRRFQVLDADRFPGLSYVQTSVDALGATRRVIVTHSASFHARQARGFAQTLAKAGRQLDELAARLARGRTRRPRAAVEAEIAAMLAPRWLDRVIGWQLTGDTNDTPASLRLTWTINARARRRLEAEVFGKRLLFTDRDDWPVAEVVAAYRAQADVEAGFRQLKDPKVCAFSPMFHWTDQKIRVHVFYCTLALAIAHLMRRQAARAGLTMSVRELLKTLASIQETVMVYPSTGGRPTARRMLTELTPTAARLHQLFGLATYAPSG